ncbi:MAG: hypothetical protein ACP5KE_07555 [Candidatus Methanodesulfokora sp.]
MGDFRWRVFLQAQGSLKLMRAWSGFTLTGSEGDAEPSMNSRGGQGLVKTKSYVVFTT